MIIARQPCNGCGALLRGEAHRCSACVRAVYCARACLEAHWPAHKAACAEGVLGRAADDGDDVLKHAIIDARREAEKKGLSISMEIVRCETAYAAFLMKTGRCGGA